jgi:hypothetical protein
MKRIGMTHLIVLLIGTKSNYISKIADKYAFHQHIGVELTGQQLNNYKQVLQFTFQIARYTSKVFLSNRLRANFCVKSYDYRTANSGNII